MYNLSSQKQRKFRLQMNENRFQLYEKLFRLPEIIEFLNYLKTILKGPLSILQKWRFTTYSLGSWSLITQQFDEKKISYFSELDWAEVFLSGIWFFARTIIAGRGHHGLKTLPKFWGIHHIFGILKRRNVRLIKCSFILLDGATWKYFPLWSWNELDYKITT